MPSIQQYRQRQYDPTQGDPYQGRYAQSGEDYGSYMGFPVQRQIGPGGETNMQINFNGEWMNMGDFQNRNFQTAFVQPWLAKERGGAEAAFREENPDVPVGHFGRYGGFRGQQRRRGPGIGSSSGPSQAMLAAMMAQQGG